MQFNNPQRNKMIVTLTIAVKVITHPVLFLYDSYVFCHTVLLKYIYNCITLNTAMHG